MTRVVLPLFWRPTSVSSISCFQKRLLNQSTTLCHHRTIAAIVLLVFGLFVSERKAVVRERWFCGALEKSRQSVSRKESSSFCYVFWCNIFTAIMPMETLVRLTLSCISACMSFVTEFFCVFNHHSMYFVFTFHSGVCVKKAKNLSTAETDIRKSAFSPRVVPFFTHDRYQRVLEMVANLMCHDCVCMK